MEGGVLVQRWLCTRAIMPDGSPGAIWRGVAYPLLDGDCIDIGPQSVQDRTMRHAVVAGEEASWVLVQGVPRIFEAARRALDSVGLEVSRSGRWLGDPVDGVAYDWFLRCPGALDPAAVAAALGAPPPAATATDRAAAVPILEQRIADLLAELARVEAAMPRIAHGRARRSRPGLH